MRGDDLVHVAVPQQLVGGVVHDEARGGVQHQRRDDRQGGERRHHRCPLLNIFCCVLARGESRSGAGCRYSQYLYGASSSALLSAKKIGEKEIYSIDIDTNIFIVTCRYWITTQLLIILNNNDI